MKLITTLLMSLALAAGTAAAQDKKDAMKPAAAPTAKECQDYVDMAKKDASKKDAKKDAACAEMMKKAAAPAAPAKDAPKK